MVGHWHFNKRSLALNEGGERGIVLVIYWGGPLAPFVDFAVRIPFRWVGGGWLNRPYVRTHRTGTWRFW